MQATSEPDNAILQRRFRYLEWLTAAFAAAAQFAWSTAAVRSDWLVTASYGSLALFCAAACFTPSTLRGRIVQLLGQISLICLASALGAHHFFYLSLLVLGAKAAVFLPRMQMLLIGGMILICHVAAGQFSQYAARHIHERIRPVPEYYRKGIVEADIYLYFLVSLSTVAYLGRTILSERKNRNSEQGLQDDVGQLAVKLDRIRIARDIHDGLGHSLTSSRINLELALKALEEEQPERVLELLGRCQNATATSLNEVRQAVRTAQHGILSLKHMIILLVDEVKLQSQLTFKLSLEDITLAPKIQHQVFSVIKECLTNVRKHSGATRVDLTLLQENGKLKVLISDDGKGFDPDSSKSGFGLTGLQERAKAIGAELKIESKIGSGTTIQLCF